MNLYEELGVGKDAGKDQIKRAYKRKSKKHHPDVGGDPEQFKQLVVAYKILSDDEKRARYDRGESTEDITKAAMTEEQEVRGILLRLFGEVIPKVNPDYDDVLHHMKTSLKFGISTLDSQISEQAKLLQKFESALKRLKTKKEECLFAMSAQASIAGVQRTKSELERQKNLGELAVKFLEDYGYEVDPRQTVNVSLNGIKIGFV